MAPRARLERSDFYPRAWLYFGLALLVTLVAFYPSYFGRLHETGPWHHLHGVTATLWMTLLVVQPLLHRLGRWDWHRRLGRVAFVLVPLVVLGGMVMVERMLNAEGRYPPGLPYQLGFIDFFVLTQFVLFFALAMKHRADMQLHARYMACTVVGPLIPALARLLPRFPGVETFQASLHLSYLLMHGVLVLLLLHDHRSGGVRLPYVLALGLMVAQHVLMTQAAGWEWWRAWMDGYAGLMPG
ncbi:MAG: hypothetical protein EA421_07645 [Gemmatimonadales bacterium]|nr:MAG: hypothetical protein EA421_07645 [Gemmatimonadales bacterium]